MRPSHSPVENPPALCGAFGDGCGRPSIQMSCGARSTVPLMWNATTPPEIGIEFLLDAQVLRPHHDVLRRVEDALPLGHVLHRHLVGVGHGARLVVDRQAGVVADVRPGRALDPVLVQAVGPRAGEVDAVPWSRACGSCTPPCAKAGARGQEATASVNAVRLSVRQLLGHDARSHFEPLASFLKLRLVIQVRAR